MSDFLAGTGVNGAREAQGSEHHGSGQDSPADLAILEQPAAPRPARRPGALPPAPPGRAWLVFLVVLLIIAVLLVTVLTVRSMQQRSTAAREISQARAIDGQASVQVVADGSVPSAIRPEWQREMENVLGERVAFLDAADGWSGGGHGFAGVLADVPQSTRVVVLLGEVPVRTDRDLETDVQSAVAAARGVAPRAEVVLLNPLPTPGRTPSEGSTAAFQVAAERSGAVFVDPVTRGWLASGEDLGGALTRAEANRLAGLTARVVAAVQE